MIDTNEKLAAFLPVLKSAAWLALDTEADSLHAYPEKVCLIQVSTPDGERLLDPLRGYRHQSLSWILSSSGNSFFTPPTTIYGSSGNITNSRPPRFSTPCSPRACSANASSEAPAVSSKRFLGVKLDKGSQKADWSRRPLTEKMEAYARNDTHHLSWPLADRLPPRTPAKDRLTWHQESCARDSSWTVHSPSSWTPETVWRIKGSTFLGTLPPLAVLRELWRIGANAEPSPPTVIATALSSPCMRPWLPSPSPPPNANPSMASCRPACTRAGEKTCSEAVRAAQKPLPPREISPALIRHQSQRPTEEEFRRFRDLERRRDRFAHELAIDPTIIASKATLGDLARDSGKIRYPELMNWQRELLQVKS